MEINLDLEPTPPGVPRRPLYGRIADRIRAEISSGGLSAGERLPPIRTLAQRLGANRDTVALAYELLAREGILEATVGRGTFVRMRPRLEDARMSSPPFSPIVERLLDFERSRASYPNVDGAIPLHALTPDPSLYPVDAFSRTLSDVLAKGGTELLAYGGQQGHRALREIIAEHLAGHGMATDAGRIVPCQGASQGISLAMRLYAEPGDWVAVEEPTYHNVLSALIGLGLRPVPVPMTHEGPDLDVLERTLMRPEVKLFYTMPSFHNPMGITTSVPHRRALLDVAARVGKPLIEDAFEMDLRFDGTPVPPLAALDRHGLVVHLFSFSKSLFPGVRVGAITATGRAVDGLLTLKHATDLSGVLILQAAVAEFVRNGDYQEHLLRLRRTLRERRDALIECLAARMPSDARWTLPEGGYQLWLELPGRVDTRALLRDAQQAGVIYAPGYQFHHDGRASNALRLTIALCGVEEIRIGIERLGKVVSAHLHGGLELSRDTTIHL